MACFPWKTAVQILSGGDPDSEDKGAFMMRLTIYVKPLSKETKLLSEPDGTLIMYVAAPPAKGKANREIVRWISKKLGKSSSQTRIIAGFHSNKKTIEILGVTDAELTKILGIQIGST